MTEVKSVSVQGLVREDAKMIARCQILKGFECHSKKFGSYPEGNKEPPNDFFFNLFFKFIIFGASLVAQWLRVCLPIRGTRVRALAGKIPHAAERLGPWATITEPACLEPVLRNKRGRDGERPAHRDEEWSPLATTGESPRTETKTQHSHK